MRSRNACASCASLVTMRSTTWQRLRDRQALERRTTLGVWPIEQIDAVQVKQIEEEDRGPLGRGRCIGRAGRGNREAVSWNGRRRMPSFALAGEGKPQDLAVGDDGVTGQLATSAAT